MKTPIGLLLAAGLATAAFAQPIPPAAPQPGPEQAKFAVWHGTWTYEAQTQTTPLGPGAKSTGTLVARPALNGFAVECAYTERGPAGEIRSLEHCWYDPAARRFAYTFLGGDGYLENGTFTFENDVCTWTAGCVAGGTAFRMKGVETVAPDKRSMTRRAEISLDDGKTWLPFLAMNLRKTAELPPTAADEEETVRQEAAQAVAAFIAACERVDLDAVMRLEADVPDYAYADIDGQIYDRAGFGRMMAAAFADCVRQKVETARQEIHVLAPDAALVVWHGAFELTRGDGTRLRAEPYNATFLFKRLGGAWKIVFQQESGLPPQPLAVATSATR